MHFVVCAAGPGIRRLRPAGGAPTPRRATEKPQQQGHRQQPVEDQRQDAGDDTGFGQCHQHGHVQPGNHDDVHADIIAVEATWYWRRNGQYDDELAASWGRVVGTFGIDSADAAMQNRQLAALIDRDCDRRRDPGQSQRQLGRRMGGKQCSCRGGAEVEVPDFRQVL